jgi:hypothetical protein
VLTVPALGKVRHRLGTAAAARRTGGPERSGPAATPQVVSMELVPSCAPSAAAGGRPWWFVGHLGKTAT